MKYSRSNPVPVRRLASTSISSFCLCTCEPWKTSDHPAGQSTEKGLEAVWRGRGRPYHLPVYQSGHQLSPLGQSTEKGLEAVWRGRGGPHHLPLYQSGHQLSPLGPMRPGHHRGESTRTRKARGWARAWLNSQHTKWGDRVKLAVVLKLGDRVKWMLF